MIEEPEAEADPANIQVDADKTGGGE